MIADTTPIGPFWERDIEVVADRVSVNPDDLHEAVAKFNDRIEKWAGEIADINVPVDDPSDDYSPVITRSRDHVCLSVSCGTVHESVDVLFDSEEQVDRNGIGLTGAIALVHNEYARRQGANLGESDAIVIPETDQVEQVIARKYED